MDGSVITSYSIHYTKLYDLAVITFRQDYSSSNFSNRTRKQQYWMKNGGRWHILYEGSA